MVISYFFIIFFIISFIYDILTHKLPNKLCFTGIALGIFLHTWSDGWIGMFSSVLGMVVLFFFTFILYGCNALGAGDVKWFAAAGSFCGAVDTSVLLLLSICCAAGYAILLMILKDFSWQSRLRVMIHCYILARSIMSNNFLENFREISVGRKIPFLLAVLPALFIMNLIPVKHFF